MGEFEPAFHIFTALKESNRNLFFPFPPLISIVWSESGASIWCRESSGCPSPMSIADIKSPSAAQLRDRLNKSDL